MTEHPQRTPVYGGLLIVGAMIVATVVTPAPGLARIPVWILCLLAALAGTVMTFRDWS